MARCFPSRSPVSLGQARMAPACRGQYWMPLAHPHRRTAFSKGITRTRTSEADPTPGCPWRASIRSHVGWVGAPVCPGALDCGLGNPTQRLPSQDSQNEEMPSGRKYKGPQITLTREKHMKQSDFLKGRKFCEMEAAPGCPECIFLMGTVAPLWVKVVLRGCAPPQERTGAQVSQVVAAVWLSAASG